LLKFKGRILKGGKGERKGEKREKDGKKKVRQEKRRKREASAPPSHIFGYAPASSIMTTTAQGEKGTGQEQLLRAHPGRNTNHRHVLRRHWFPSIFF